jgi:hypothetical protein
MLKDSHNCKTNSKVWILQSPHLSGIVRRVPSQMQFSLRNLSRVWSEICWATKRLCISTMITQVGKRRSFRFQIHQHLTGSFFVKKKFSCNFFVLEVWLHTFLAQKHYRKSCWYNVDEIEFRSVPRTDSNRKSWSVRWKPI